LIFLHCSCRLLCSGSLAASMRQWLFIVMSSWNMAYSFSWQIGSFYLEKNCESYIMLSLSGIANIYVKILLSIFYIYIILYSVFMSFSLFLLLSLFKTLVWVNNLIWLLAIYVSALVFFILFSNLIKIRVTLLCFLIFIFLALKYSCLSI
jgi:hypothetical protein